MDARLSDSGEIRLVLVAVQEREEAEETWAQEVLERPLILCCCGFDKAILCAKKELVFDRRMNRDHSHKKQQPPTTWTQDFKV